jgi:hypothetical protein
MDTTPTDPRAGSGIHLSRRTLLRGAVGTGLLAVAASGLVLGTSDAAFAAQDTWRWCDKCQGLWYAGNFGNIGGVCPADSGLHSIESSGNYTLNVLSDIGGGQEDWRWCSVCEGLWFAGGNGSNRGTFCPANRGNGHNIAGSGVYVLNVYPNGGGNQTQWRWCSFCSGLWYFGFNRGVCPSPFAQGHDDTGSGDYYLKVT